MEHGADRAIPEIWPVRPLLKRAVFASGDDAAVQDEIIRHFDQAAGHFEEGRWRDGMQLIDHTTAAARRALSDNVWTGFSKNHCIAHPVGEFTHEDPFTRRQGATNLMQIPKSARQ